jgi:MoxR-like ATPase
MSMGYPNAAQESEIIKKTLTEGSFEAEAVLTTEDVMMAKLAVKKVFVHEALIHYIVEIVNNTRNHPSVVLGVSPRGSQLLVKASQAAAFVDGRDFVKPDDIKFLAPYVFGHRIVPKVKANKVSHAEIIEKILETVSVPG